MVSSVNNSFITKAKIFFEEICAKVRYYFAVKAIEKAGVAGSSGCGPYAVQEYLRLRGKVVPMSEIVRHIEENQSQKITALGSTARAVFGVVSALLGGVPLDESRSKAIAPQCLQQTVQEGRPALVLVPNHWIVSIGQNDPDTGLPLVFDNGVLRPLCAQALPQYDQPLWIIC
ncbi:MAG: hypothetical protein RL235_634 [Chlamydiota bacterium]|jgi:hypothetical protein